MSDPDPADRVAPRAGIEQLGAHLGATYGVQVRAATELDLGTHRIDLADGRTWVARVHPAQRPGQLTRGDAEILEWLRARDYPAERLPDVADPVSTLRDQAVLVTEWVAPVARSDRRSAVVDAGGLRGLGALLARLQTEPTDDGPAALRRPGGAWHHLADGRPVEELAAARRMLDDAPEHDALRAALGDCDDGEGLTETLVHPDFVMANVVVSATRGLVFVDWSGTGRGPRIWPLAFLLWSVGAGDDLARVDRTIAGYRERVELSPAELDRLEGAVLARPVVFEVWAYATGRRSAADAATRVAGAQRRVRAIAQRARAAFST